MNTKLPDSVCKCGSKKYKTHCQKQCQGDGVSFDRWTTKEQREANPHWQISDTQLCVYLPDDTWIECSACGLPLTKAHCDAVWQDWRDRHPEWDYAKGHI